MNYTFYKKTIDTTKTIYYMVNVEDTEKSILKYIDFTLKNKLKLQILIDGIEESITSPIGSEYIWANEDVTVYANENGVLLTDLAGQRAGITDPEELSLRLNHEEFITFLKDFKKFVEEN